MNEAKPTNWRLWKILIYFISFIHQHECIAGCSSNCTPSVYFWPWHNITSWLSSAGMLIDYLHKMKNKKQRVKNKSLPGRGDMSTRVTYRKGGVGFSPVGLAHIQHCSSWQSPPGTSLPVPLGAPAHSAYGWDVHWWWPPVALDTPAKGTYLKVHCLTIRALGTVPLSNCIYKMSGRVNLFCGVFHCCMSHKVYPPTVSYTCH